MWHGLDEWLVLFANGVITNSAKYSDSERNLAGRRFCDRLKLSFQEGMTNSPAWSVGVQAMYENRTSIACAVAIDSMLVDCIPEYGTSTNRLACANAIVANTNAWENCRAYFENVTNTINELVAYPAPRKRYKTPLARRGGLAAILPRFFACLKCHFPAAKIFYDLRLDLRFVCYNGCELNDKDMY